MDRLEQIRGCLLGGAAGDALGAPIEFLSWRKIESEFGLAGIDDFPGGRGYATDDTQMMLFTAEGLLRALVRSADKGICHVPGVIHHALLRWLVTQGGQPAIEVQRNGWLIEEQALWQRRAPGTTCLTALGAATRLGEAAVNDSKGCGGVMRAAPCAFFRAPFHLAADAARLTHGHPAGYQAAGLFADMLARLAEPGATIEQAAVASLAANRAEPGIGLVADFVDEVLTRHRVGVVPGPESIAALGAGWVAEEALAIGLWCALSAPDFASGVRRAVNHGGDSDSTGLIAGHFLGLHFGTEAIPRSWLAGLDLRRVVERMARDLFVVPLLFEGMGELGASSTGGPYDEVIRRYYPGA